jgi:hypothetical protein
VPVFDPEFDTFASVRARSGMLFDTICAVGCRAEHGLLTLTKPMVFHLNFKQDQHHHNIRIYQMQPKAQFAAS